LSCETFVANNSGRLSHLENFVVGLLERVRLSAAVGSYVPGPKLEVTFLSGRISGMVNVFASSPNLVTGS